MKPTLVFNRSKVSAEIGRVAMYQLHGNVAGLIGMLDSDLRALTSYSIVRGHAAAALGRLGDPRAIPYLVSMRHDPEVSVRQDVMRALGKLQAREAEGVLLEALSDPAPLVRMTAASSLARIGAVNAISALWKAVDADPDRYLRVEAVEALIILGDETARDRVPEALRALSWRARGARWKRLREAADTGDALTPWELPWDREPKRQES